MKFVLPLALLLSSIGLIDAFAPKALSSKGSSSRLFASVEDCNDKDVVIVGGGISGLSIAHYLATKSDKKIKSITLLDRTGIVPTEGNFVTESASSSAAGAITQQFFGGDGAPYNPLVLEDPNDTTNNFLNGLLLSMCLESSEMYGKWTKAVEEGAKNCPFWAADKYLWEDDQSKLERWEVGYSPKMDSVFPGDPSDNFLINVGLNSKYSVPREDALKRFPLLNGRVDEWSCVKETASVDAQRLLCSLRAACAGAGVDIRFGESADVTSLKKDDDKCIGVNLKDGSEVLGTVVVASGAVLDELTGEFGTVSVQKNEGHTLVLTTHDKSQFMSQSVFSTKVGVLPKPGGRVRISDCFDYNSDKILEAAEELVPAVSVLEAVSKIKAYRPMTLDYLPILGTTEKCDNLYVAGGFNTYGLWLAPKASQLIGDLIIRDGKLEDFDEDEKKFLEGCSPDRTAEPPITIEFLCV